MNRLHIALFASLFAASAASAQTIAVEPLHVVRTAQTAFPTVLIKPGDTGELRWAPAAAGLRLKVGNRAGVYTLLDVPAGSGTSLRFTPASIGLPVGVYYAVLTNSDKTLLKDIQRDALRDPTRKWSPEFVFAVESPVAPAIIRPRGTVDTPTPTFEWEAIPGVQSYLLVVSSTPFAIRTDPATNEPVVEGISLVWPLITTATSAVYGQADPRSPFPQFPAPPLVPGEEYNYTVLNGYSKTDPSFLSDVFGSVVGFTYEALTGLRPPQLELPAAGAAFYGDRNIRFSWTPVDDAVSYTFSLFERRQDDSSIGEFQVFSQTTPSTSIDVPASAVMRRGTYTWYVLPNDATGAGGISERRTLTYEVPMGQFTFVTKSAADGAGLIGVRVVARSVDGGFSPVNPFINATSVSYSDSLVAGRYAFDATKPGFADTTATATIVAGGRTTVNLHLRPLPSRLSGIVQTPEGVPVENATVQLIPVGGDTGPVVLTGGDGSFEVSLSPGSYRVTASLTGYTESDPVIVEVASGEFAELPHPLVIRQTAGFVSGRVTNETGQPVQLATVRARRGDLLQEVTTNADGRFVFTLAAGTWSIDVRKSGFVSPSPIDVVVARGEQLAGIALVLTERASRITGTVVVLSPDTGSGATRTPLGGAVVEAIPASGAVLRTHTDATGAFVLDVGAGSYTLVARAAGYAHSDDWAFLLGLGQAVDGLVLELESLRTSVSGRVVDALGLGIPAARVHTADGYTTVTDASGSWRLELPPGISRLGVDAAGFVSPSALEVGLQAGEHLAGLSIRLASNAALVTGRVTQGGVPVPRAVVVATGAGSRLEFRSDDQGIYQARLSAGRWSFVASSVVARSVVPVIVNVLPGQTLAAADLVVETSAAFLGGFVTVSGRTVPMAAVSVDQGSTRFRTASRTDGSWAIPVPSEAASNVTVSAPGALDQTRTAPSLTAGESLSLSFDLATAGATVAGTVRDPDGLRLAGATVLATQSGRIVASATTVWDGTYRLLLTPGEFIVRVSAPRHTTIEVPVILSAGEGRTGFDLELAPARATISGLVLGPANSPIPGADVRLSGPSSLVSARTDSDGRFVATGLVSGNWLISATAAGPASGILEPIELPPGGSVQVTLRLSVSPGRLSGAVRDLGGAGISGATVVARHGTSGVTQFAETGLDGSYELSGLEYGLWILSAARNGYGGSTREIDVSPQQAEWTGVDFDLAAATGRVAGRVVSGQSGLPLPDALLLADSFSGSATARTDAEGSYEFNGLPPGEWRITAAREGYRRASSTVLIGTGLVNADFSLVQAEGRLTGRVTDQAGNPLPFVVRVVVSDQATTRIRTTDAAGTFDFDRLEPGLTYEVRTDVSRVGYSNARTTLTWPAGVDAVGPVELRLTVSTSEIAGNTGTSGATVRIVHPVDGTVRANVESLSDGSYRVVLLPAGTWRVVPRKEGNSFNPAFRDITVGVGGRMSADFQATSSVADIRIVILNRLRQPVPGVDVIVSSTDGLVVRSGRSGSDGSILFVGLPLARDYSVRPSVAGSSFEPSAATISLVGPGLYAQTFSQSEASGVLSGQTGTLDARVIPGAVVRARHEESGGLFQTTPDAAGRYEMGRLPAGQFAIWAGAPGFRSDTLRTTLADGERRSLPNLILQPAGVRLTGRVLRRGRGIPGVPIQASAQSTYETVTDGSGAFVLSGLALGASATDTVTYRVRALPAGGTGLEQLVRVAGSRVGQVVVMPDFVLPSGVLTIRVDDGLRPQAGIQVMVAGPNGTQIAGVTDADGRFVTPDRLGAGFHDVSLSASGRLAPTGAQTRVSLNTDTSRVDRRFSLPFRHETPTVIPSHRESAYTVHFPREWNGAGFDAWLRYRRESSGSVTTVEMSRRDTVFSGSIPAPFATEPIRYRIDLVDRAGGATWTLPERTVTPVSPGLLSQLRLTPALDGAFVRVGEGYLVDVAPRDGLGESLAELFDGPGARGTLNWTIGGPGRLEPADSPGLLRRRLVIDGEGPMTLSVHAVLDGVSIRIEARFDAGDLGEFVFGVSSNDRSIENRSTGIPLLLRAVSPGGQPVLLGESVQWTVEPPGVGVVDERGFFVPTDPSFIGPVVVSAVDARTGSTGSTTISLFARLDGSSSVVLTDGRGLVLRIPSGAIPFPADIGLGVPVLAGPKRNVRPSGSGERWVVGDRLHRFTMRSDLGLEGDSLRLPAVLSVPEDASIGLHEGDRSLGRFDASSITWTLLESAPEGASLVADVDRLTEFGTLVRNEALGLRHVAVLPSPFSPDDGPLRIGYFLSTDDPPALVTVRIHTMRGEPVRTLFVLEAQFSGRYGSRTGEREVLWDGLTDSGARARNGRYLVEITATDASGTVREIVPVVLVK